MKVKDVSIGSLDMLSPDDIIIASNGMNGRYTIPTGSMFRVKYVGDQHIVAQGLNSRVSLGEYVFDYIEINKFKVIDAEFETST